MENPESVQPSEELRLQQLLQIQFWQKTHPEPDAEAAFSEEETRLLALPKPRLALTGERRSAGGFRGAPLPAQWNLTQGIVLHSWQEKCVSAWFSAGRRGVIKVVTGAGKTVLALEIAGRLQREELPDLRVAIVVPTIVLLEQWREELLTRGNLPASAIGLMGGGHDDRFDARTRILICVLHSAAKKLPELVRTAGVASSLLLIVDECHRAGATEMQKIFHTPRACTLGLSATPERENDLREDEDSPALSAEERNQPVDFNESVLGQELGPVIFELNYAEAIELGVLPPFGIVHYGLSLKPKESVLYESVSREIKDLRKELERPGRQGLALIRWCRSASGAAHPGAARLIGLSSERKRVLFRMAERGNAVLQILRSAFAENPATKAILFHESIEEVMRLFMLLRKQGFPVVAEHSEFPEALRAGALQLFRVGSAQIIVSAKSLIEGFNVPSADLGIIIAATSSVRQRVQTLGRLLRKSHAKNGIEKHALLHVLYATKTVDEMIYEKADWERFVGAERNQYFLWPDVENGAPQPANKAPRAPAADEASVELSALVPRQTYPASTEQGPAFTRDSQGTIRSEDGRLIQPHAGLTKALRNSLKSAGRFRITPARQFVIELDKTADGWRGVYLGRLESPVEFVPESAPDETTHDWKPGDSYPVSRVDGKIFSVLQRDPRLIALKNRGEVRFVLPLNQIVDPAKRTQVSRLQTFLKAAYTRGHRISKVSVTPAGHVVYVFENQAFFAGHAPEGGEGFVMEA